MDLLHAVKHNYVVDVRRLVKTDDPNRRNKHRFTPLMIASDHGVLEIVQILFQNGADVNARSVGGETALIFAARNKHPSVVEYLLQQGADVNAVSNSGCTALQYAAWTSNRIMMGTLFAYGGASTINQTVNRNGRTALHFAASKNDKVVAILLMDRGASKTIKDREGNTPKDVALAKGYTDLANLLV
jgi:serine/threonine-protein phosphatase 6 regulatory ankyrin repeat subunit B